MNKEPIFISFANQKGGIGKSTLTILAASWLRYVRGLNILVVDCDFPQNSIYELREREKKCEIKHDRPDLGNNGLSVKAYVNNILNAHLEQYRNEINNLVSKPGNFKL